jgi:hypothetical protein
MPTLLKLGPADEGRPLTLDEFFASDYQEGYRYELIDGRLSVLPQPNLPASRRHGKRWRITQVPFGETYTTRLLPDFALLVDPRR